MFTLAPLALAAAAWLMPRVDPTARLGLAFDRDGAVELGARELAARGAEADPVEARLEVRADDALERYLRLRKGTAPEAVAEVYRLAPPFHARVLFPSRDGEEESAIRLAADGRTLGMSLRRRFGESPPADLSEASTGIERAFLEEWLGPHRAEGLRRVATEPSPEEKEAAEEGEEPGSPAAAETLLDGALIPGREAEEGWESGPGVHFWVIPLEGLEELTLTASTLSREGQIAAWRFRAEVEESFREARLERGGTSLALRVTSGSLLFLVSGLFLVWGLWRYWLRFQEAEVSHARTLLLAFTVAVLVGGSFFFLLQSSSVYAELEDEFVSGLLALAVITATTAASVLPLGLLLGAVWSGCEGDVRAIFPDRLKSLDALLAGRWLSSNPADSMLAGAASASWVVLAQLALWLPWLVRPEWGPDLEARRLLFVHPFQAGAAVAMAVLIPYSALGLMAPLSFLRRWTASRWRTLPVLGVFLLLVCLQLPQVTQLLPAPAGVLSAAVWAAAFLVPFFVFDLVAAFWSFLLAHLGLLILLFLQQPAEDLRRPALLVAAGIALLLGLSALVRRFGREVSDVEVRPGYARNIQERLALSAELGAAQQARARLLPAEPPPLAGARLSACSASAEGEYYDYFRRPDGSLALVAADFGRHGLAAALRLTLAKGFLLSYSDRALPPAEASRRLVERLAELVYDPEEISLVYGVYDPADRSLEMVSDLGGVWVLLRRADGRLDFALGSEEASGPAAPSSIRLELSPGDTVIFLVVGRQVDPREKRRSLLALKRRPKPDAETVLNLLRKRGSTIGTVVLLQVTGEERA